MSIEKDEADRTATPAWPAAATEAVLSGDDAQRIDLASDTCPCQSTSKGASATTRG